MDTLTQQSCRTCHCSLCEEARDLWQHEERGGLLIRDALLSIRETCDRLRINFQDDLLTACQGNHLHLGEIVRDVYQAKYPDVLVPLNQ